MVFWLLSDATKGSNVVRPIHDPFWDQHRPGDRWNCKCSLEPTDEKPTAIPKGYELRGNGPQAGLNENPGKTGELFAQSHPYFPQTCAQCAFYQGGIAGGFKNQEKDCERCKSLQFAISPLNNEHVASKSERQEAEKALVKYYKSLLPEMRDGKFIQKRLVVSTKDGDEVIINKNFYDEIISKHKDDVLYLNKLEYAKHAHEMITKATLTDPNETAIDYEDAFFRVYEFVDEFYRVEMKVKCNRDGNFLHILRLFKK